MKHLMTALLVGMAIVLSGCTGDGKLDSAAIIAACKTACGFIPSIDSVQRIIGIGDPIYSTVSTIAKMLCDAFLAQRQAGTLGSSLASGTEISFPVTVKGETIIVKGTVQ